MEMRPISSAGICIKTRLPRGRGPVTARGITLIEMLIVVSIIALLAGIAFPSLTSAIQTVRLNTAARNIASFEDLALSRTERMQEPTLLTISQSENVLTMHSLTGAFTRSLSLGRDIRILSVLPVQNPVASGGELRNFFMYPGGAPPAMGVRIANRDGRQRLVTLDPITGVPKIVNISTEAAGS